MKQRAEVFIEFAPDLNVAWLQRKLKELGCKTEVRSVFLPLMGMTIPEDFKFDDEKPKWKKNCDAPLGKFCSIHGKTHTKISSSFAPKKTTKVE